MNINHFSRPLLAAAFLVAAPVQAADDQTRKDPQELASEGVQSLMRAMELLLLSIPQYETPFMNENGDIIIRRKHPETRPAEPKSKKPNDHGDKAI